MDNTGGAYGYGKATGVFDIISFAKTPTVIVRAVSWLLAVIVIVTISSGWYKESDATEMCLYHGNPSACNFGTFISIVSFLACIALIGGEYLFQQTSCVKTRRRFVLGDAGFSGIMAFFYFLAFCYLTNILGQSKELPNKPGVESASSACFFAFFAILTWSVSVYFAYQRFKQGVDINFAPNYDANVDASASYGSYPMGMEADQQYQDPPFATRGDMIGSNEYQQATY